jgi:hypothetical protein
MMPLSTAVRLAVKAQLPISANEGSALTPRQPTVVGSRGGPPARAGLHSERAEASAIGTHTSRL